MTGVDIAATATGFGGAVGLIRATGPTCIERVAKVFSRPKALLKAPGNTTLHGWILDTQGQRVDEVVLLIFRAPKSYTGEDMVEVSTHGGVIAVTAVFNALLGAGFLQAERGEFTLRAFLAGKLDLTAAESVAQVVSAKTKRALGAAEAHLNGELFCKLDEIKKLLVDSVSAIEVDVEYPEDENTITQDFSLEKAFKAQKMLANLEKTFDTARLFNEGVKVALLGAVNAGKSTLFNALLKNERSIVSPIAGTTRDYIEASVDFGGVPAILFDTAGLRKTDDFIEAVGVEKSLDLAKGADVVLYLIDSTKRATSEDEDFIDNTQTPTITVLTKCDNADEKDLGEITQGFLEKVFSTDFLEKHKKAGESFVLVSAKESFGLDALTALLKKVVLKTFGGEESEGEVSLANERQLHLVKEARQCVDHGLMMAEQNIDGTIEDFLSAIDSLAQITGEVTTDDILSNIFSKFCVGK